MDIITQHQKYIQFAYNTLSDIEKKTIRRYGPYDRIKIKRIGLPSGLAAVYEMDFAKGWIAKVNVLHTPIEKVFAENNDFANNKLRPFVSQVNNNTDMAKIAVYGYKKYFFDNNIQVAVTFETMMKGRTLQEVLEDYPDMARLPAMLNDILNKVKRTLKHINAFVHHDLHSGNLFVDDSGHPIIFDFDWGTFAQNDYAELYQKMKRIYDAYFQGIPNDVTKVPPTSCTKRGNWYLVNRHYSLFAQNGIFNENVRKADMAMLVNDILIKLCDKLHLSVLDIDNIDNKINLNTETVF